MPDLKGLVVLQKHTSPFRRYLIFGFLSPFLLLTVVAVVGCKNQSQESTKAEDESDFVDTATTLGSGPAAPMDDSSSLSGDAEVESESAVVEKPLSEMSREELFPLFSHYDLMAPLYSESPVDEDFFDMLQPDPQQTAMLTQAAIQARKNRQQYIDLKAKYPFDSPQRDEPEIADQFSQLNRELVSTIHKANSELGKTITEDQLRGLIQQRGGIKIVFLPCAQRLIGIGKEQGVELKQEWDDAGLAIEQLHEKLGDAVFYENGREKIMMLRHDQLSHLWWQLSADQIAKLDSFNIQKPPQVAPIAWLPPRSPIATAVKVKIKTAKGPGLQAARRVVVVRAIIELAAQRREILTAVLSSKFESRDSCELSNFSMERRSREIGSNVWESWMPVSLADAISLLAETDGMERSRTFSPLLSSSVATSPLPILESGSWQAVESHPEATIQQGHKVFRFPDFTTKVGHEYQYRLKLKWWFQRTGQAENGVPLQDTEVDTPFSNPSGIVTINRQPDTE